MPSSTSGPVAIGPWMPQWVIGRTSFPLKRGSSQMCGASGGVVRRSTRTGGSPRRSHVARFAPARAVMRMVRSTAPLASMISTFTESFGVALRL